MKLTLFLPLLLYLASLNLSFGLKDFPLLEQNFINFGSGEKRQSFEDEYKLFEEELDRGVAKHSGKRQKRYVFLNTESNVDVGFLIVIPITVVLPGMTNLFNVWRRKRSLSNNNALNVTSESSPYVQAQVDRISSYFDLIHIPETSCHLRTICELAAEPSRYFPLSDVILSRIQDQHIAMKYYETNQNSNSTTPTLYSLYNKAADDGSMFGAGVCEKNYGKSCKYSTDKLLNMPVMKFWNNVQSKLKLKFEDETDINH